MVVAFALFVAAGLLLDAGITGRSLGEVIRGDLMDPSRRFHIKVPDILTTTAPDSTSTVAATAGNAGGVAGLLEVFYDPLGVYFDSGRIVQGAIGGHRDHVHVGGDHALVERLARTAHDQFHLTIRELLPWDAVDPVHVPGSLHYSGRAFDASGSAADMMAFARWLIGQARGGAVSA